VDNSPDAPGFFGATGDPPMPTPPKTFGDPGATMPPLPQTLPPDHMKSANGSTSSRMAALNGLARNFLMSL